MTVPSSSEPRSGTRNAAQARATHSPATSPAFMSHAPRPWTVLAVTRPPNGGSPAHVAGSPVGTTSTCALSSNDGPASRPGSLPTTPHASRRSTSTPGKSGSASVASSGICHASTSMPISAIRVANTCWTAFSSSEPDTLGTRTSSASSATISAAWSSTYCSTRSVVDGTAVAPSRADGVAGDRDRPRRTEEDDDVRDLLGGDQPSQAGARGEVGAHRLLRASRRGGPVGDEPRRAFGLDHAGVHDRDAHAGRPELVGEVGGERGDGDV